MRYTVTCPATRIAHRRRTDRPAGGGFGAARHGQRGEPGGLEGVRGPYVSEDLAEGLLGYWASTDGSPAEVTGETENLTGHRARTFAARAAEHADAFRA